MAGLVPAISIRKSAALFGDHRVHKICRKRTCRKNEGCQGGFGPPCYLQQRNLFADAVRYELDEYRTYWNGQHRRARHRPSWTPS
jgi:hypothetical protein